MSFFTKLSLFLLLMFTNGFCIGNQTVSIFKPVTAKFYIDPGRTTSVSVTPTQEITLQHMGNSFEGEQEYMITFIPQKPIVYTITYEDIAGSDTSMSYSHEFTVTGTNSAPNLSSISNVEVAPNTLVSKTFSVSDAETTDAADLTASATWSASGLGSGRVTIAGSRVNRTLKFTPSVGGTVYTITYNVSDGFSTTTKSFTVTTPNTAPTASQISDTALSVNETLAASFVIDDAETNSSDLSVTCGWSTAGMRSGTIAVTGTGRTRSFTFVPTELDTVYTITYSVDDGDVTTTKSFTVTGANSAPSLSGLTDTSLIYNTILEREFTFVDAETDVLNLIVNASWSSPNLGSGSVPLTGDGATRTFQFTPTVPDSVYTITYSVNDGYVTTTKSFTVTGTHTVPTLSQLTDTTTPINMLVQRTFEVGDLDTEMRTGSVASLVTSATWSAEGVGSGPVSTSGSGVERTLQFRAFVPNKVYTIAYHVEDDFAFASKSFTVTTTNTAPEITQIADTSVSVNTEVSKSFNVTDAEVNNISDISDTAYWSADGIGSGDVSVSGTGTTRTVTFTPSQKDVVYTITYIVDDGYLTTEKSFTVTATNDAPTLTVDDSALIYIENDEPTPLDTAAHLEDNNGNADWNGGTLTVQITANAEADDKITIPDNINTAISTSGTDLLCRSTVIGTLSSPEGTVTNSTELTITFNGNANNLLVKQVVQGLFYNNSSDTPGTAERIVTITAADKYGEAAVDSRTISVRAENDIPQITSNPILSVVQDAEYRYEMTATDPDGDDITFSVVYKPSWLSFINGNTLIGTPSNSDVETRTIQLEASDGASVRVQTFEITVTNVNDAPEFITAPVTNAAAGQSYMYDFLALDADGDALTYSYEGNLPGWLTFDTSADEQELIGGSTVIENGVADFDFEFDGSTLYVSYVDYSNNQKAAVKKLNDEGTQWISVGTSGFSEEGVADLSLAIIEGVPYVAFADIANGHKLTVMRLDSTETGWEIVGTAGISDHQSWKNSITGINGVPYVLIHDKELYGKATVYKFNSLESGWEVVGNTGFSKGSIDYIDLKSVNGTPYALFQDAGNSNKASLMRLSDDGSNWEYVGTNGLSDGSAFYLSMAIEGETPYVTYSDGENNFGGVVKKLSSDGQTWELVGGSNYTTSSTKIGYITTHNGVPYILSMYDSKVSIHKLNASGTGWEFVGEPDFGSVYPYSLSLELSGGEPYIAYANFRTGAVIKIISGTTLSGTPTSNDMGTHDITFQATDGTETAEHSFTITVAEVEYDTITSGVIADVESNAETPWVKSQVYNNGDRVSYNNHNWQASWWTQREVPGSSDWGAWKDLGVVQEINVVGGTLLPEGQVAVEKGTDQLFTAAAKAGYMVDYYVIDGVTVSVTDTEFLFEAVDGAHDIKVHFKKQ